MTMETGELQVLNPERSSVTSSLEYLKNQESTTSMKLPILFSYLNQPNSKKIYPPAFGNSPPEQPDRALQSHHPSEARTIQDGKALQTGISDERKFEETF